MTTPTRPRPHTGEPAADTAPLAGSHFTLGKALREVSLDLATRLPRTLMTALGTAIGIAVLVATLGLAASASANITNHFDELSATLVTVQETTNEAADGDGGGILGNVDDQDALAVDGVEAATNTLHAANVSMTALPTRLNPGALPTGDLYGVTPGWAQVAQASLTGATITSAHIDRRDPVAVVGRQLATTLQINDLSLRPVIYLDDQPVTVIGIIDATREKTELLNAVLTPYTWANTAKPGARKQFWVRTRLGAAEAVAPQLPVALTPTHFRDLDATAPPTPTITRNKVSSDTQALLVGLALISLIVGAIGIANVTLVSVMERTGEIGLRRALGATRRHVVAQFLLESSTIGCAGAILGATVGILATVLITMGLGWPPIINPVIPLASPLLGLVIGALAGIYPAWRAGNIEPIAALRTTG